MLKSLRPAECNHNLFNRLFLINYQEMHQFTDSFVYLRTVPAVFKSAASNIYLCKDNLKV